MGASTLPDSLAEDRSRIRATLVDGAGLLCCLDFDGTLAPIVEEPAEAVATPENRSAVATLAAAPAVTTAIVSGRALADVRDRIDGPAIYAGNHGLELERDGSVAVHPVARKRAVRLTTVCATLERVLEPIPGCRVENKRVTGTVHVRAVPSPAREVVRRRTRAVVDRLGDGLEVSPGKRILEIEPSIPWGKGNTVAMIAADLPSETVPIYVGDDVTDESAFRVVETDGIGIRVGSDAPSAASRRLDSPDDVSAFLEWLGSVAADVY